jgi:hypothetical protein
MSLFDVARAAGQDRWHSGSVSMGHGFADNYSWLYPLLCEHILALQEAEQRDGHPRVGTLDRDLVDAASRERREGLLVLQPLRAERRLPVGVCLDAITVADVDGGRAGEPLVGAVDVATDGVETPAEVAATIRSALPYVAPERLYPCTNCGMVPLDREVARAKLRALVAGTALVRRELGGG